MHPVNKGKFSLPLPPLTILVEQLLDAFFLGVEHESGHVIVEGLHGTTACVARAKEVFSLVDERLVS